MLARYLGAHDYGRYVATLAVATSFAPVLLGGPAFLYLEGTAFGLSRPMAALWQRLLIVAGGIGSALTPVIVGLITQDWHQPWLWFAVGLSEIVFIGLTEIAARHFQAREDAHGMGFWQCAPQLLRLCLLVAWIASVGHLTLTAWVVSSTVVTLVAGALAISRLERRLPSATRIRACSSSSVLRRTLAQAASRHACWPKATSRWLRDLKDPPPPARFLGAAGH